MSLTIDFQSPLACDVVQFEDLPDIPDDSTPHLLPGWVDPVKVGDLIALRRQIHRIPEVGWTEFVTTARLALIFRSIGYGVCFLGSFARSETVRGRDPNEAKHAMLLAKDAGIDPELLDEMQGYPGFIAEIDTGKPGKTVAFRFELDALFVDEPRDIEHFPARAGFASTRKGCMHACGHDGHQAVAVGLARFIKANISHLTGKLRFIFQPAEEGTRGAYTFIEAGALNDVDQIYCAHLSNELPLGTMIASPQRFLCTTKLDFAFEGTPSHAGMQPEKGRHALLAAASAATMLMALPRHSEGMTRVNVGSLHAGEGRNIIPSHATMEVEVRGETDGIREDLCKEACMRVRGVAEAFGVRYGYRTVGEATSFNPDASVAQLLAFCARRARFISDVRSIGDYDGSDDGTLMIRRVQERGGRAGYFMIGAAVRGFGGIDSAVDFDERALVLMYDIYANLVMALDQYGAQVREINSQQIDAKRKEIERKLRRHRQKYSAEMAGK